MVPPSQAALPHPRSMPTGSWPRVTGLSDARARRVRTGGTVMGWTRRPSSTGSSSATGSGPTSPGSPARWTPRGATPVSTRRCARWRCSGATRRSTSSRSASSARTRRSSRVGGRGSRWGARSSPASGPSRSSPRPVAASGTSGSRSSTCGRRGGGGSRSWRRRFGAARATSAPSSAPPRGSGSRWPTCRRRRASPRRRTVGASRWTPRSRGRERVRCLAHELAHEVLHQAERARALARKRPAPALTHAQKETEAEAAAYVVLAVLGLEPPSPAYIAWQGGTGETVLRSLGRVQRAARRILEAAGSPAGPVAGGASPPKNGRARLRASYGGGSSHTPAERAVVRLAGEYDGPTGGRMTNAINVGRHRPEHEEPAVGPREGRCLRGGEGLRRLREREWGHREAARSRALWP